VNGDVHPENSRPPEDREATLRAIAESWPGGPEAWWEQMRAKLRRIIEQAALLGEPTGMCPRD